MIYRRSTARFSSSSEREACLVPPLCMGDSTWTHRVIFNILMIIKKRWVLWHHTDYTDQICTFLQMTVSAECLLSFLCWSKGRGRKTGEMSSDTRCSFDALITSIGLLGEDSGDFTSGLGATGWTGLVCLAASFFRLMRLFSNISRTELCFWKTRSTWSWWRPNMLKLCIVLLYL